MTGHSCGAPLAATAQFCHKCGARAQGGQATGSVWRVVLPWSVAAAVVGGLLVAVIMRVPGGDAGGASGGSVAPFAGGGGARSIDISSMTPQERANRLFDRVMRYAEANQLDSVQTFLPMALQAHAMLPVMDTDARFHLGLLHLAGGDPPAALAQADTIRRAAPTHLFSYVLRARALAAQGDQPGARRAYRDFLSHETAERATAGREYADHATTLDLFRDEARRATGG